MPDDVTGQFVSQREMYAQQTKLFEDLRMDQGVLFQRMREDWRGELKLELKSFKNEIRFVLIAGVAILKFDIPSRLTAAALGTAAAVAVGKAVASRIGA